VFVLITLALSLFGITTIAVSAGISLLLAVIMLVYNFFPGLFSFLPFIG